MFEGLFQNPGWHGNNSFERFSGEENPSALQAACERLLYGTWHNLLWQGQTREREGERERERERERESCRRQAAASALDLRVLGASPQHSWA